ncbi:hypothetical protein RCL1_009085 [Eukaryota sp. TZLM3-RCL]
MMEPAVYDAIEVPKLSSTPSDDEVLAYLQGLLHFADYEDFFLSVSSVKMDPRLNDPNEKFNDYLVGLQAIKSRACNLGLSDSVFMVRFATGVSPKGLAESLSNRIYDGVIKSFPQLCPIV